MNSLKAISRLSRSLYARLALVYLASLVIMSLATAWIAVDQFDQLGHEWLQRNRINLAANLARQFEAPLAAGLQGASARQTAARIKHINPALSIFVLDDTGRVVGAWGNDRCALGKRISIAPIQALLSNMPMLPIYAALPCSAEHNVFSVTRIHYGPAGQPGYLFVVPEGSSHLSMARMWQTSSISHSLLFTGMGALLLSAFVGLLLFALLTRRFSRLTQAVQRFADGDHSIRIAVHTDDEIGRAARAFNEMAAIIEAQVEALRENDLQRRDLVANLSHDFRTPLTTLRGHAEQLQQTASGRDAQRLQAVLTNVGRLTRLADQLSLLSKMDIPERPLNLERFPLAELVHDIVVKFRPQADAKGIDLRADCTGPLPVTADIELIDRALSNLVDNAIHATGANGRITLSAVASDGQVRVTVTDTGVGIATDELGLVTQRFYRTRDSRRRNSGSGLGLAIVAEVCARHDTRLELVSDARGTSASFMLADAS